MSLTAWPAKGGSARPSSLCETCSPGAAASRGRSRTRAAALSRSSAASVTDELGFVYADTSAIVKLVVREAETDAMTE